MKRLFGKFIFAMNLIAALALLLSYLLPYVSPKTFPLLSVLSLTVPILILINLFFLVYWIIRVNKKVLLSLFVLILGFSHVTSLYKLQGKKVENYNNSISLFTYNVHSFNRFKWISSDVIPQDISALVKKQNPDIFCAQEFYNNPDINFTQYKHKYQNFNNDNGELALVIYSKYPIVNKGSLRFNKTANNVIFADIAIKNDTVRVYNVHFQSHRINPNTNELAKADSQKLLKRIQVSFEKQQEQAQQLIAHMESSPYKFFVMGDFNNTAYSYIYNQVKSQGLQDTFKAAGKGFGKTFKFELFPVRIDFILVHEDYEVIEFKTFDKELSDHYPIFTRVRL